MSVVLNGSASADMTSFTGKWHFAKELQRRALDFGYKRVAGEVPRDLLNFVSFIHPNGAHPPAPGTFKRNRSKNKKRRARGRHGTTEAIAAAATAEAAAGSLSATAATNTVNNEVKGEEAAGTSGEGVVGNENEQDPAEEGGEGEDEEGEDQGEEDEDEDGDTSASAAAAEGAEGATGDQEQQQQQQGEPKADDRPTHPAPLRTDHPLFGLWEGSFEIVALTPDAETQVSETFFLHSFFGEAPGQELADLPPEARFSSTVLKTSPVQLIPNVDVGAGGEEQPIVLVGFGRNKFGRFSLTASFRPSLCTLVIEKKYMLTKYPQNQGNAAKRRRQSNDQHALDRSGLARSRSFGFGANPDLLEDFDDYLPGGATAKRKRGKEGSRKDRLAATRGEGGLEGVEYDENGAELLPLGAYQQQYIPNEGDEEDFRAAFYDEQTGEVYEGGWFNGKRHGRGICLYIDGSMYEGNWNYGKEHGHGQLMSGDRQVICVGEWMDGLLHGHGTYNFASGDKYTGEFREGNRHGKGELFINGGCRYMGEWKDNRRWGRGLYTWPDGSFYDGEWENDKRHGKGLLEVVSHGFRYDGYWIANHPDGRGTSTFVSGMEYQGSFKAGLREGRGSITFPGNIAVYEGRFRDDRIDGQGTLKILADVVDGVNKGETLLPIDIQADLKRIHLKAGFGFDLTH